MALEEKGRRFRGVGVKGLGGTVGGGGNLRGGVIYGRGREEGLGAGGDQRADQGGGWPGRGLLCSGRPRGPAPRQEEPQAGSRVVGVRPVPRGRGGQGRARPRCPLPRGRVHPPLLPPRRFRHCPFSLPSSPPRAGPRPPPRLLLPAPPHGTAWSARARLSPPPHPCLEWTHPDRPW